MRIITSAICAVCVLLLACSTDTSAEVKDASVADDGGPGGCDSFTKVGSPCDLGPGQVCFRQCKTDGCTCRNAVWACTTDFSCTPDAGPLVDASGDDVPDADVADAADAASDSWVDAGSDALSDAGSDAPGDG